MKEPSKMSVLGILMKRDAEISQPDNGRMADSWQVILKAISQPAPPAAHSSPTDPLRSDPENTRLWTPYTAFDSQNASRGNTHFPGRRFVYQALALVMVVAVFLAIGLVIGRGNLLPTGKPTVTIPEDTIPLTEPSASRPSPADLEAFFSASDSEALARLPLLPGEQQRTGLQTLCSRNGLTLNHLPAAGEQTATYWTARRERPGQPHDLLLLARENKTEAGWTVVYQLVPAGWALPQGSALDNWFTALLAVFKAG